MKVALPDYLPSRYESWLEYYYEIVRIFKEQGRELNDETIIKRYDFGDYNEHKEMKKYDQGIVSFYQEVPFMLIKSRALDFIISHLPTKSALYPIFCNAYINGDSDKVVNNLFKICPE